MSIVVWRGDLLAVDQQHSFGDTRQKAQKLFTYDDYAYSHTGDLTLALAMTEWYKNGAVPQDFPKEKNNEYATRLIVLRPTGLEVYEDSPYPMPPYLDGYAAWGSGMQAALGALHHGADAVQAVQAAIHHADGCGYGVSVIKIPQMQR